MLIKGRYSVEVSEKYGKKVILEVVDDHVVEEGVEHEELGILVFGFNFLMNRGIDILGMM